MVTVTTRKRKTPALMFQGTSSHAGKSVLTAAFCRMLLQDGFRVAPFKAQNMSLNSYVTPDGREIGRAQATQAAACRLEPDARMNPVLLKPSSDTGAQVVVLGRPVGRMDVATYIRYKPEAFALAKRAYDELAAEHEVMVLEGAGSPAEINLKAHDIVNMAMAAHASAMVLLVGDIDRGGVFASLVGTMELLDPWERDLVAGFLVNRFRGDVSLLDPALDFTQRRTDRPFFGVVPYLSPLGLPEEDSVGLKEQGTRAPSGEGEVCIALVDLPRIANFTDLDALRAEPDVRLQLLRRVEDIDVANPPDAVILPGSKSTLADLAKLRATGLAAAITALAETGSTEIVGICAGMQMLGERIADADGVDSAASTARGLGLLPLETSFKAEKILMRVQGRHLDSGLPVTGYEIHHGRSTPTDPQTRVAVESADGRALGYASSQHRVWGSYVHGVFDDDTFRRWFVDRLRSAKGLPPLGRVVAPYSLEPALDRLADLVRKHTDWRCIYQRLGLR